MAVKRHARLAELRGIAQDLVKNVDIRQPHEAKVLNPNSATYHGRVSPVQNGAPSNSSENVYGAGFDNNNINTGRM